MKANRRDFLKTAAITATPVAPPAGGPPIAYPRVYSGRQLAMLAFPLGGVGAGSLALGGRGQLRDWEIFNRPDKGRAVSYAFASLWVQAAGKPAVARVLESQLMAPYQTAGGLAPAQVAGLARFESATFTGEYPRAHIAFADREVPVKVELEAFTPIIPLDAEESGLPAAILRYKVTNPGPSAAKVSVAFSMENPAGLNVRGGGQALDKRTADFRTAQAVSGLYMSNPGVAAADPLAGSFAVGLAGAEGGRVSYLRGWPKAKWWASPLLYWDDFTADGELGPEPAERNAVGSLCLAREIAPGAQASYTFVLAWHFPNRTPAWCGWSSAEEAGRNAIIGNYYATRFGDAWAVAEHTARNLPKLEKRMQGFLEAMRETTLPAAVKDAAMANLSTLATTTCFRTADGKFRGFEGVNDASGCCHGNCTHVWNYETTSEHLFPSLARSMREAAFELSNRLDGMMPIRIALPEGTQKDGTTAADGTMGQIIKTYLDWQLSGDLAWLTAIWPRVKHALEFAWIPGGWDADRDGVMAGVQHNTYDVEFYGPNPMCGIYYLGALRAASEMAKAVADERFAAECRDLAERGAKWIDANLFNGEHYVQKIRPMKTDEIAKPLRSKGGAEDPEHPDFQMGEGCLTDQLIGQYLADVAGLGPLVDAANIRKTIATIYKYNRRANLGRHNSVERIYALNDEAAVLVCDYAAGKRPRIPFPYSSETWTGMEYLFAAQLVFAGMTREGIQCYDDIRRRYDGERRNPWDEPECGHHYARAMSAWSGILALSGFRYLGAERRVIARPRVRAASFTSFWSNGTAWGTFRLTPGRCEIHVREGKLVCRAVELDPPARRAPESSARAGTRVLAHQVVTHHGRSVFVLGSNVEVNAGETLALSL